MRAAVVGSGVSGIAVIHALLARGAHVTVLDVGETLEPERQAIVSRLHDLPTARWAAEDLKVLGENPTGEGGSLPKKLFFGSDRIYASGRPFAPIDTLFEGRVAYPTFTRGGFSTIWGAAVLPVDACDMTDWPITRGELEPYLQKARELIPLSGGQGTLSTSFPEYGRLASLDPSAQGRLLLEDLRKAERRLSELGVLYGAARLAIHAETEGGESILPCNGCGQCFMGCVRGSIYSTVPQLDALIRTRRVEYRGGFFVQRVEDSGESALVTGLDVPGGRRETLTFDAVFLAAGPLNTTRVLLRSRKLFDRVVHLKESQKFALPLLRLRAAPTAIERPSVTLGSVFIETKVAHLSDHWVHAQISPLYQLVLDGAPIPGKSNPALRRLWSPLLRRLMIAWCGMHSDHSSRVELTLRQGDGDIDRLELNVTRMPAAVSAAKLAASQLAKNGLAFKTLFVPPMMKLANPGSGTHCGSSFPMRRQPADPLDTDTLGRPFGWSRVFAVDASVLPSIPGTTLALSVMANAYRIGAEALRN